MIKRALLSVSNKEGIVELAQGLVELGVELVSTGGTASTLKEAGVPVTYVADITGFPEILDGRVKTLHPKVHGGILALRSPDHLKQLEELEITPIDLVVVNLYPFAETVAKPDVTLAEAVENIDIGGPTMVRAAAKNHEHVLVVVNPKRYSQVLMALKNKRISKLMRRGFAQEAFAHTATYDIAINQYLTGVTGQAFPAEMTLGADLAQTLRYGENPHQHAAFYRLPQVEGACVANAQQLHGKELSYNNLLDANAALELVREFTQPAVTIIKHNNPCGCAVADDIATAYQRALEGDPLSAFGGIVAATRPIDEATAKQMNEIFLEAIVAPDFTDEALEILTQKKNLRLLKTGDLTQQTDDDMEIRKINGGLLLQQFDRELLDPEALKVVSEKQPSQDQLDEMIFAMAIVKHVKSNAIVVTKDKQLIGVGAGQMNRVGSANIAFTQAGEKAKGAVMASDAFIPFRDTIDSAAGTGIAAIIQPGGSMRDDDAIAACNEHQLSMVFTGMRHFKH